MKNPNILLVENVFILLACIYIIRNIHTCPSVKIAISIVTVYVIILSFQQQKREMYINSYIVENKFDDFTKLDMLTDENIHDLIIDGSLKTTISNQNLNIYSENKDIINEEFNIPSGDHSYSINKNLSKDLQVDKFLLGLKVKLERDLDTIDNLVTYNNVVDTNKRTRFKNKLVAFNYHEKHD